MALDSHRRGDVGMRLVADQLQVLEPEVLEPGDGGVELQRRQRPRVARKLKLRLLQVIQVQMGVNPAYARSRPAEDR
jgi:hypothetical protein